MLNDMDDNGFTFRFMANYIVVANYTVITKE